VACGSMAAAISFLALTSMTEGCWEGAIEADDISFQFYLFTFKKYFYLFIYLKLKIILIIITIF